jgi:uncharacterized protein (DUF433 family)
MDDGLLQRITVDPLVMAGKAVIRGTRIPVDMVVRMVAQGIPEHELLREYPRLTAQDIRAALTYAAEVVAHENVFPMPVTV